MMQNNVKILPVNESHLPKIVEMEQAIFSLPWSIDSFRSEMESPDSHFTAAVLDSEVVGFCVLHFFDDEGEIFNIAVSQEHRGKKIGDILLSEALGFADGSGIDRIFLEVRKSNLPAIGLYTKHGFEILGIRKNYYDEPTEDAIIMQREK